MLKVIRDNLKYLSWVLWAVIVIFVLFAFVDFGSMNPAGENAPNAVAARVGDDVVTMGEFEQTYRNLENQYRQAYGGQFTPELARQMQLPLQALNQSVNQRILVAEARRLGLGATDREVQETILDLPVFQDDQGRFVGEEKYLDILRQNGLSVAEFEQEVRQEILLRKLQEAMLASVYVTDREIERAYRDQVEKAKIRYVELPRGGFLAEGEVPRAELEAHYQANRAQYRQPEQREASYLLVDPARLADQVEIGDEDLREYFEVHRDEFTHEEQVQARHILVMVNDQHTDEEARRLVEQAKGRIAGGEDFAAVAREVSEDTGSKARGGDLGFFGRGAMVPAFEEAAFGAQQGELVGPVQSSFGYHLIQVTDRRAGGTTPFAEVQDSIRSRIAQEKAGELAEKRARELAQRLQKQKPQNAQALEAAAGETPGATLETTGRFGRQQPLPGVGFAGSFHETAFGMEEKQVSDPVQLPGGWAVIYLDKVHEPSVPELSEVEPRVRQEVLRQKRQQMAVERLEQARKELQAGKAFDQVAADLGLAVQESQEFGAQGAIPGLGMNPELSRAALALKPGQAGGPVATANGAVLFEVTERKEWEPAEFAKNKAQTRDTLRGQRLQQNLQSLLSERRRELDVTFSPEVLESFGITQPVEG
jgi:peptidyl-prolyl cis-trans isomerase D